MSPAFVAYTAAHLKPAGVSFDSSPAQHGKNSLGSCPAFAHRERSKESLHPVVSVAPAAKRATSTPTHSRFRIVYRHRALRCREAACRTTVRARP